MTFWQFLDKQIERMRVEHVAGGGVSALPVVRVIASFAFPFSASSYGLLSIRKGPELDRFRASSPRCVPSALPKSDAGHTSFVCLAPFHIPHVGFTRDTAKICPAVIIGAAIDVVDVDWLLASHPLPNDAVLEALEVIDASAKVAISFPARERRLPRVDPVPNLCSGLWSAFPRRKIFGRQRIPNQNAGFRRVAQQLAETGLRRQSSHSHRAVPLRGWLGPRGVSSTVAVRHLSISSRKPEKKRWQRP